MHSTSATRDLPDFHRESKEIMTSIKVQTEEIKMNRKQLFDAAKNAQDSKCVASLRSGYFLHLSKDNVKQISSLAFVQPDKFVVSERLIELTKLGPLRTEISRFLGAVYKVADKLPEIFASLPSTSLKGVLPFLPEKTEPNHFLAFSTLPALFGHCWTSDLRYAYINFLIKISENLPPSAFTNLHEHWILDCFTHYIHSSDIHQFLRASIGDTLLEIIRDETLELIPRNAQRAFFDRMIPYIEKILNKMKENIDIFPLDVRILIRKFANLAPDDASKIQRIESLFCKGILAPAISLPKMYCVLPQTFNFKVSGAGTARALQVLASLFLYILHPSQANLRYSELDHEKLAALPFGEFLRNLVNVNCDSLGGLKFTSIMPLLGMHNIFLVFSVPDICMLSHVMNLVNEKNPALVKPVMIFAKKIPTNESYPMIFFRHELWDLSSISLPKPEIRENELEKAKDTPSNAAAKALFNFLQNADELTAEPPDLTSFLAFHENIANLSRITEQQTFVNHLKFKIKNVPDNQTNEIIPCLEDETRRQRAFASRNSSLLTHIAIRLADVNALRSLSLSKAEDSLPVMHEKLFDLFLESDDSLLQIINSNKSSLLACHASFIDFFHETYEKLKTFIEPLGSFAIDGVAAVMHSWMMQKLTLKEYKTYHSIFLQSDKLFLGVNEHHINRICIAVAPPRIRKMFSDPQLFVFAQQAILEAYCVEIPIEAVKHLQKAFDLLKKAYMLTIGGTPSDAEMDSLTDFLIITSKVTDILSFAKYLEHSLCDVLNVAFVGSSILDVLSFFMKHVAKLDMELALYLLKNNC